VPVVDTAGRPVGIVSKTDVIAHRHDGSLATAADAMTPVVVAVPESASVPLAAALMIHQRVHRLPVVAEDGRVIGMLSTLDVTRWIASRHGYLLAELGPELE
jgi:CBS domain-containing protein